MYSTQCISTWTKCFIQTWVRFVHEMCINTQFAFDGETAVCLRTSTINFKFLKASCCEIGDHMLFFVKDPNRNMLEMLADGNMWMVSPLSICWTVKQFCWTLTGVSWPLFMNLDWTPKKTKKVIHANICLLWKQEKPELLQPLTVLECPP